jgi:hypothetical protein
MTFIGTVVALRDKLAWYKPERVASRGFALADPMAPKEMKNP